MRTFGLCLGLFLVLFLNEDVCAANTPTLYVDSEHGFSVSYPTAWEHSKNLPSDGKPQSPGPRVLLLSPPSANTTDFRANVNVVVEPLPAGISLAEYFKRSQDVFKKTFPQYVAETQGQTTLSNTPFKYLVFSHKLGGKATKVLQYSTVRANKAYVLTCSCLASEFKKHRPEFRKIVGSWQWTTRR